MDFLKYKKQRLKEQLEFFAAKKTKFVSVYAKKPKILIKPDPPKEKMMGAPHNSSGLGNNFLSCHPVCGQASTDALLNARGHLKRQYELDLCYRQALSSPSVLAGIL